MSTRLDRAIEELRKATSGRAFVLVVDRAHQDAGGSALRIDCTPKQPVYTTIGLLRLAEQAVLDEPGDPGPDNENGEDWKRGT